MIPLSFPVAVLEVEAAMDWPVIFKRKSAGRRSVFSEKFPCSQGTPEEMPSVILWTMLGVHTMAKSAEAPLCPAVDGWHGIQNRHISGDSSPGKVFPYYLG